MSLHFSALQNDREGSNIGRIAMFVIGVLMSALFFVSPSSAQAVDSTTTLDDIVVVARRSGAPMWEVTKGNSIVLLVGEISSVPSASAWRPDALSAAAGRSQRILFRHRADFSPADWLRLFWRSRSLMRMPDGKSAADYLEPAQADRLAAFASRFDEKYETQNFLFSSINLLNEQLDFERDSGKSARDVVREVARRERIESSSIGSIRGDEIVDSILSASPQTQTACIVAAMDAVDAGPEGLISRGMAWTRFDVPTVMSSPLERALGLCWPWGDPELGQQLRVEWYEAIEAALGQAGVTMAVVPLRVLAEEGGLLDELDRNSYDVVGPTWRPAPDS